MEHSQLATACRSGNLLEVRRLVKLGVSVDEVDTDTGAPILLRTLWWQHEEVACYLIGKKADPCAGACGTYPLREAAELGFKKAVRCLLLERVSPLPSEDGPVSASPFIAALRNNHVETCDLLLSRCAAALTPPPRLHVRLSSSTRRCTLGAARAQRSAGLSVRATTTRRRQPAG